DLDLVVARARSGLELDAWRIVHDGHAGLAAAPAAIVVRRGRARRPDPPAGVDGFEQRPIARGRIGVDHEFLAMHRARHLLAAQIARVAAGLESAGRDTLDRRNDLSARRERLSD